MLAVLVSVTLARLFVPAPLPETRTHLSPAAFELQPQVAVAAVEAPRNRSRLESWEQAGFVAVLAGLGVLAAGSWSRLATLAVSDKAEELGKMGLADFRLKTQEDLFADVKSMRYELASLRMKQRVSKRTGQGADKLKMMAVLEKRIAQALTVYAERGGDSMAQPKVAA
jgi:ribosomal protein L29